MLIVCNGKRLHLLLNVCHCLFRYHSLRLSRAVQEIRASPKGAGHGLRYLLAVVR